MTNVLPPGRSGFLEADTAYVSLPAFVGKLSRDAHEAAERGAAGQAISPTSVLDLAESNQRYQNGAEGTFYSAETGTVKGKYVRFNGVSAKLPVPVARESNNGLGTTVSNNIGRVDVSQIMGIRYADADDGSHGWVQTEGLNKEALYVESAEPIKRGDLLGFDSEGRLAVVTDNAVAVVLDDIPAETQDGMRVIPTGSTLIDPTGSATASGQSQETNEARLGEIERRLPAFLPLRSFRDFEATNQQAFGALAAQLRVDITSVNRALFRLSQETRTTTDLVTGIELTEQIAAVANFANQARVEAANADESARRASARAAASLRESRAASVAQTQTEVASRIATEQSGRALVSKNEAAGFATAAFDSSTVAEAASSEAEQSASVAQDQRIAAETASQNAGTQAAAAEVARQDAADSRTGADAAATASQQSRIAAEAASQVAEQASQQSQTEADAAAESSESAQTAANESAASAAASRADRLSAEAAALQADGSSDVAGNQAAAAVEARDQAQGFADSAGASSTASTEQRILAESARGQAVQAQNQAESERAGAEQARIEAQNQAQASITARNQAETFADDAGTSAAASTQQRIQAQAASSTATQRANDAAGSAADALSQRNLSQAERIAAEQARNAAQGFSNLSSLSQAAAELAEDAAALSAGTANQERIAAALEAANAGAARLQAVGAAGDSLTARNQAINAAAEAEGHESAALDAAAAANQSAIGSVNASVIAGTAREAAEVAATNSNSARAAAIAARDQANQHRADSLNASLAAAADRLQAQQAAANATAQVPLTQAQRAAAEVARGLAQQQADRAQAQADLADADRIAAQAASVIADSAAAAADQDRAATETARSQASAFANQAQGSAQTAQAQAGVAQSAATQANAAGALAESARSLAAEFAQSAQDTLGSIQPRTFEDEGRFFKGDGPSLTGFNTGRFGINADGDPVFEHLGSNSWAAVAWRQRIPFISGHDYKVRARTRGLGSVTGNIQLRLELWAQQEGFVGGRLLTVALQTTLSPTGTWQMLEHVFPNVVHSNAQFISPEIVLNWTPAVSGTDQELLWFDIVDVTAEEEAKQAASQATAQAGIAQQQSAIATGAASQAAQSQQLAASHSSAAQGHANTAGGHAADAANQAGVATTQAGISSGQAALATQRAAEATEQRRLAASLATGYINPNASFNDWDDGEVFPTEWFAWQGVPNRVAGNSPNRFAANWVGPAGDQAGFRIQDFTGTAVAPGSWYVLEAEVTLKAGTFAGSGVYLEQRRADSTVNNTSARMSFTGPDSQGEMQGDGTVGKPVRFAYLFKTHPQTTKYRLFAMAHWPIFNPAFGPGGTADAGDTSQANEITFHSVGFRRATQAEIAQNTVLDDVQAIVDSESIARIAADNALASDINSVSASAGQNTAAIQTTQTALADLENSAAILETVVAASGGNPAIMRMLAGVNGSEIVQAADRILMLNPDGQGGFVTVASFENGVAKFNSALFEELQIRPNPQSAILSQAQLEPLEFLARHNIAVQYQGGATFGIPPRLIVPQPTNLPALANGEAYDIRPTNITATQFTPRIVRSVPGSAVVRESNAGNNVGGTPQWRANKPTTENAFDERYEFKWAATLRRVSSEPVDFGGGGQNNFNTYAGRFALYCNGQVAGTFTFSEALVQPASASILFSIGTVTRVANFSGAIPSGANRFGIHPESTTSNAGDAPVVNSFAGVTYTTQSASSVVPLTQAVSFLVYPPR